MRNIESARMSQARSSVSGLVGYKRLPLDPSQAIFSSWLVPFENLGFSPACATKASYGGANAFMVVPSNTTLSRNLFLRLWHNLDIMNRVLYTDRTLYGCCYHSRYSMQMLYTVDIPLWKSRLILASCFSCVCTFLSPWFFTIPRKEDKGGIWCYRFPTVYPGKKYCQISTRAASSSFVGYRCRKSKAKSSRTQHLI